MSALARLHDALGLPVTSQVERRVPKSLLVERAELSAADKRIVEAGLERMIWRSTLRPAETGLSAFRDDVRDYAELVVMTAEVRPGAKVDRLIEVLHRAVAHPLVLVAGDLSDASLSVGLKRRHEREAGRVVVERLVISPAVQTDGNDPVEMAFRASLGLAAVPVHDLWSLHQGWGERAEAFAAGRITGTFRLAADSTHAETRRAALTAYSRQAREVARLRKAAAVEKRLSRRIDLSREVALAEAELARLKTLLA